MTFLHYKNDNSRAKDIINSIREGKVSKNELRAITSYLKEKENTPEGVTIHNPTSSTVLFEASIQMKHGHCSPKNEDVYIEPTSQKEEIPPGGEFTIAITKKTKDTQKYRLVIKHWLAQEDEERKAQLENEGVSRITRTLYSELGSFFYKKNV